MSTVSWTNKKYSKYLVLFVFHGNLDDASIKKKEVVVMDNILKSHS